MTLNLNSSGDSRVIKSTYIGGDQVTEFTMVSFDFWQIHYMVIIYDRRSYDSQQQQERYKKQRSHQLDNHTKDSSFQIILYNPNKAML